jgi:4-amino-4-deoxy-L-arabinose transferase-like glycosyltransferase
MAIKTRWLLGLIVFSVVARLLLTFILPFADTTEARYADIARMMVASNDWVTPWFLPGEPFWGKPPLSFWFQALSFKLLGINEAAGRLPSTLMSLLTAWLVYLGTQFLSNPAKPAAQKNAAAHKLDPLALLAVLIYCSMALPFVIAGAVMTDSYLVFGTTLTLVSLIAVLNGYSQPWRWLFFMGLAVGLLSKGPLTWVLCGLPVFLWVLVSKNWRLLWQALPWIRGTLFMFALAAPWYVMAEIKTPGFLQYFLVGEHFNRFVVSDWSGDLYGDAHEEALGAIWLYMLQASFPWGIVAIVSALLVRKIPWLQSKPATEALNGSAWLMVFAVFTPAIFFTLSSNILWTYALPALPFLAILCAFFLRSWPAALGARGLTAIGLIVPATALIAGAAVLFNPALLSTEKYLLQDVYSVANPQTSVLFVERLPFSARYYSRGQARLLPTEELDDYLSTCPDAFVAIRNRRVDLLSRVQGRYKQLSASQDYQVYQVNGCGHRQI